MFELNLVNVTTNKSNLSIQLLHVINCDPSAEFDFFLQKKEACFLFYPSQDHKLDNICWTIYLIKDCI